MKGEKGHGPITSLEVTSSGAGGACDNWERCNNNGCLPLCVYLCDQNSNQSTDPQYTEDRVFFAHLGSHMLCASSPGICVQPPVPGVGVCSCYCAKSWNWLKLTAIYPPSLQQILEFQNTYIRQILPVSCPGGRQIPCFLLGHLPGSSPQISHKQSWYIHGFQGIESTTPQELRPQIGKLGPK